MGKLSYRENGYFGDNTVLSGSDNAKGSKDCCFRMASIYKRESEASITTMATLSKPSTKSRGKLQTGGRQKSLLLRYSQPDVSSVSSVN